ncbi:MAG: substrate-binding domain-containing protein [Pirellulales bacterium]
MKTKLSLAFLLLLLASCRPSAPTVPGGAADGGHKKAPAATITLATTYSPRDSGLLDLLLPMFREKTGIELKVVAVGSGQAIEIARRGDADVLLTHSPAAEEKFMADGDGAFRQRLMFNDFVLIGPQDDPAQVRGQASILAAMAAVVRHQARFISRGDESGTHVKERDLWNRAGLQPAGDWYVQSGAGMTETLRMADELNAYTLADRGSYLATGNQQRLPVAVEGDPLLVNPYSVMVVNSGKHPGVQQAAAQQFADFLLSPDGQAAIATFGTEKFGQPLFRTYDNSEGEQGKAEGERRKAKG